MTTRKNNRNVPALVLAAAAIVSANNARADIATIVASADAQLDQSNDTLNNGSGAIIVSGKLGANSGGNIRRGLFLFNVAGAVPPGSTVNSAQVSFTVVKVPPSGPASTFDLRLMLSDWTESGVTWSARTPTTTWSVPGATGNDDSSASASSSVFINNVGAYTFPSSAALVADVKYWMEHPESNFGWLLISEDEDSAQTARQFAAREGAAGTRPTLTINFTKPAMPPQLAGASLSGGAFHFTFNAEANRTYVVEYRGDMNSAAWTTATNIPSLGTPAVISVNDTLTTSNRFYRVRTP